MNGENYFILAYLVSGILLWGYAARLWVEARNLKTRLPVDESALDT